MIPSYVRGAIAPTFTAFNEDLTLDDEGQRELIDFMLERGGVSAFFIRSGMGQMFTFSYDDVKQIAKNTIEHLRGKAPVMVGCAGIWDRDRERLPDPAEYIRQAVELSKFCEDLGADAVVHTVPDGLAGMDGMSPAEISITYFETICEAVDLPVFIYQSPGTDEQFFMAPESMQRIAEIPNTAGIKISSSDVPYLFDIAYSIRGMDFALVTGAEYVFYSGLGYGSPACIGQGCTVNPFLVKAIQDHFEAGEFDKAMDAQWSVNKLARGIKNSPEFFKRYAAEKGYNVKPYGRSMARDLYSKGALALTGEVYESYKRMYEEELGKFAGLVPA
jgi:4-hydroxy-tetrahydrodipicolinate synthase